MALEDKIKKLQEAAQLLEAAKEDKDEDESMDNDSEEIEDEDETESAEKKEKDPVKESVAAIDLGALFEGSELSEEFKAKATTIFEAAVAARVAQIQESLEEELAQRALTESVELKEGLVEKVDGYLDFVVEQWMKENQIALERGVKAEIFESFIGKMKDVFVEHNINLPDEEFDLVESTIAKSEALEESLNEQVAENIRLNSVIKGYAKDAMIKEHSEGMTAIDAERFALLAEEIQFDDEASFKEKLSVIRENYTSKPVETKVKELAEDVTKDANTPVETITEEKKIDPAMRAYLSVINS